MNTWGSDNHFQKMLAEKTEKFRELVYINEAAEIIRQDKPLDEIIDQLVFLIKKHAVYHDNVSVEITYRNNKYLSPGFRDSNNFISNEFVTLDGEKGEVTIFYEGKHLSVDMDTDVELEEDRILIREIGRMLAGYINRIKSKEVFEPERQGDTLTGGKVKRLTIRKLLQLFLDKHNADRDIFHDLMPFKVKEILLVASLYDAYSIEGEGQFTDHILGEYHQLNLTSIPRITAVSSGEEAMNRLKIKHYDQVIIMIGADKKTPIHLYRKIKKAYSYLPTFLLLNNNNDIPLIRHELRKLEPYDHFFVWNGDSKVFFAMVKLLEDRVNADNDTKIAYTKVILLVEDNTKYFSRYLPVLYTTILEQTKNLIEDVGIDDRYKVLKLRARPKVMLATTYEEAIGVIHKYKDFLLGVISDARFPKEGKMNSRAGYELLTHVRNYLPNLPLILQSYETVNEKLAEELNANFIDKNSATLFQDLRHFVNYYLGFGHFVYRDKNGREIAVARSMAEFEDYLKTIPEDSLAYHAMKNHFSLWLMARGETMIARIINPLKVSDFKSIKELREFLIDVVRQRRREQDRGKIVPFSEQAITDETNIVNLASGSLGGKGRGLTFTNTLIYKFGLSELVTGINMRIPRTSIIGTDEFDLFMDRNHLRDLVFSGAEYTEVQQKFLEGTLTDELEDKLRILLQLIRKPVAIRSSSLLEDSLTQPFSGIFRTYILPNTHPDLEIRLRQTEDAIKLVFASIYSPQARSYFEAIDYKIDEEKMAVVIQEVVGSRHDVYYYPHISGTAQSFNYYPVAHMKPEEGFAIAAIGLGQYVMTGEKTYRFSPRYPKNEIYTPQYLVKNSQTEFYAVDLKKSDINLLEGEEVGMIRLTLADAEKHDTLKHCVSVYDANNDRLEPGLSVAGPRVVNFANILKYDYIPLAKTIDFTLDLFKEALGSLVEIEYAVDLEKDEEGKASFYILQIKPLISADMDFKIDFNTLDKSRLLLFSSHSMGNGKIETITDVIFVDPDTFENVHTREIAAEIASLNEKMIQDHRFYVLIGPGRWGTRDRFIGIPVNWPQISHAKIIVETSLEDFPLDASLGSHFFHNVTSMNVGYFSVQHYLDEDIIRWDILKKQEIIHTMKFCKHVRFDKPLKIYMNGKKRSSAILFNNNGKNPKTVKTKKGAGK